MHILFRLFVSAAVSLTCAVVDSFFSFFLSAQDEFEMQAGAIEPGQTVVVVDDIIATGALFFFSSTTGYNDQLRVF